MSNSTYALRVVAAGCIVALMTGCASSTAHHASPGGTQSSTASHATAPSSSGASLTDLYPCLSGTGATVATVPATTPLPAALLGSGSRTAVLANESDEDACSWSAFAKALVHKGFRVALFNYEGAPADDEAAVARYLEAHGARSVLLVGASEGAKASILAATKLSPGPAAVISLSAEQSLLGSDVAPYARKLHAPTLFVTAADDPYGSTEATKGFYRTAPATAKKLVVVPGQAHGTALLTNPTVAAAINAFVSSHAE
jgi:pimeloyl-ACP methyl ester carboxylesterase